MKSIGYEFIEPSTFEVVSLRNDYSSGYHLIEPDTHIMSIVHFLQTGEWVMFVGMMRRR